MTATTASIRAIFTEFSDSVKYPDALLQAWINIAPIQLNPSAITDPNSLDYLTSLYVCHNICLSIMEQKANIVGGIPGEIRAPKTGATNDKVSKSMDTSSVLNSSDGQWNLTSYGIRFIRLAKMWGAGGIQLMPAGSLGVGYIAPYVDWN